MTEEFAGHKSLARDIAAALRKHDAYGCDISFRLSEGPVFEQARMTYHRGRHGSEGTINLILTTHLGDFKEFPEPTKGQQP